MDEIPKVLYIPCSIQELLDVNSASSTLAYMKFIYMNSFQLTLTYDTLYKHTLYTLKYTATKTPRSGHTQPCFYYQRYIDIWLPEYHTFNFASEYIYIYIYI